MNKIHIKTFDLEGEYIELTSLLKVMNLAQTGGQAGHGFFPCGCTRISRAPEVYRVAL